MKDYWIYVGTSGEGLLDVKYFRGELNPIPSNLIFVGTASLKDEFFGKRLESQFEKELNDYYLRRKKEAEKYEKD